MRVSYQYTDAVWHSDRLQQQGIFISEKKNYAFNLNCLNNLLNKNKIKLSKFKPIKLPLLPQSTYAITLDYRISYLH